MSYQNNILEASRNDGQRHRVCEIPGCGKKHEAKGLCFSHYARWRRHGDPLKGGTPSGAAIDWLRAHKDFEGHECLIWPFSTDERGYGQICQKGKKEKVSAVMCKHRHGPPPTPYHEAAHTCGKGHLACVNPQHVRWATATENAADKILHGTVSRGAKRWSAKLTEANVIEIRSIVSLSARTIADKFNVSERTIRDILSRRKWRWL